MQTNEIQSAADRITRELEAYSDPEKKIQLPRFFKTGQGQYGEGDRFIGVSVPNTRIVAKQHKNESLETTANLLNSPWHECRLCALLILVERFKKGDATERETLYRFYLDHTQHINNWDLVDLSAPYIVGEFLYDTSREELFRLAESTWLWNQRIAVVATLTFIRKGDLTTSLALAEQLLSHRHDLMHKAVGWVLREVGKRNKEALVQFLEKYSRSMPRTMLRYAIEKFPEEERRYFMKR